MKLELERLLAALEELMKERLIIKNEHLLIEHDELSNIVSEIINTTYQTVGMREIERRVTYALKFDMDNLEKGLKLIEESKPQPTMLRVESDPVEINPQEIIRDLHKFINDYKSKKIDRINALFNFELYYDGGFDRLLMTFSPDNKIFDDIQSLLNKKLNNIDDDEALLFWATIKSWFNVDDNNGRAFPIFDDIIPGSFFSSRKNLLSIREKCARTIAKYIPLTLRRMVEDGANMLPMGLAGVAKILTITDTSNISSIKNIEYLLIRSVSQTIAVYEIITNKKPSDLAKTIGADKSGLIFDGEYLETYKKKVSTSALNDENKNNLLVMNVKRLIEYTLLFTKQHSRIEEALRQYKMGQEVIHPARKIEFRNVTGLEIYLQKDMCKFLIERNILAFGRDIGRNQIDLYHKDILGEDFIIEAKIYSEERRLTLNSLKKNVVQLQSYMDLHDQPRGILAIYNFTNTLLTAPKIWLKGRILIICINLCDLSASSRKSSIQIVESQTEVIELITVDKIKKLSIKKRKK